MLHLWCFCGFKSCNMLNYWSWGKLWVQKYLVWQLWVRSSVIRHAQVHIFSTTYCHHPFYCYIFLIFPPNLLLHIINAVILYCSPIIFYFCSSCSLPLPPSPLLLHDVVLCQLLLLFFFLSYSSIFNSQIIFAVSLLLID